MLKLLSVLKLGGIKNMEESLTHITHPSQFQIGKNSREWLKELKNHFLMKKSKKSHPKTNIHGTS